MKDFVKALEKHAKVRFPKGERNELNPDLNEPDEDVTYWVCTPGGDGPERSEEAKPPLSIAFSGSPHPLSAQLSSYFSSADSTCGLRP